MLLKLIVPVSLKKEISASRRYSRKRLARIAKLCFAPEQAKIGPALAQIGINSMEFCDRFNLQTRGLSSELLVPVRLKVFSDKSFNYSLKFFQLRDLVLAFDLDLSYAPFRNNLLAKPSEDFLLNCYRLFLIVSNEKNNSLYGFSQEEVIKTVFAYLKSFQ